MKVDFSFILQSNTVWRVSVYRWMRELHTRFQGTRLLLLIMLPSSISDLQGHLRKGRRRLKDLLSGPKMWFTSLCPHSTHHNPVTGLHPHCKRSWEMQLPEETETGLPDSQPCLWMTLLRRSGKSMVTDLIALTALVGEIICADLFFSPTEL